MEDSPKVMASLRGRLLKGGVLACERPTLGLAGRASEWPREVVRA